MGSVNHDQGDIFLMAVPLPRDDKWIAKIEANFPNIKQVRWVQREWKTPPTPLPEDLLDGVTLLCTGLPIEAEQAALLTKVRYVQIISAGADRWLGNPLYQNPNVTFCTSSGTHPPQIAEWVIGSYLMMSHQFLSYHAEQQKARWSPLADLKIQDSPGLRMGILGYGAIGRQCARLGQALGMEVYAYTRSPKPTAESKRDDSYVVPGTGDPEGTIPTQWFSGPSREDVNRFLSQDLDLLVLALPLTESTKYILGREQFEMLSKRKAFVSNIARGAHIDTEALIEALKEGKIRGAALDVTDPEPLPDGHELWTAPNVFITPHVSWKTPHYFERVLGIIERNLEGMRDGKAMINVVDKAHHY